MPQTLQCPKCNKAVSVSDQVAGKRVNCPHCSKTFLAPGIVATKSDDDDWLSLDDTPAQAANPKQTAPKQTAPKKSPPKKPRPKATPPRPAITPPRPAITPAPAEIKPATMGPAVTSPPTSGSPSAGPNLGDDLGGDLDDDLGDLMLPPVDLKPRPNPNQDLADDVLGDAMSGAMSAPSAAQPIDDVDALEDGVELVDDFTSTVEPVPKPAGGDLFSDLPPVEIEMAPAVDRPPASISVPDMGLPDISESLPATPPAATPLPPAASATPPATTSAPAANDAEYASEYRVRCHICGTKTYAKAAQQGKTIKCTDCHTELRVPPPPKIKKRVKVDIENSKTFTFEDSPVAEKRGDPYRRSADDLLREAAASDKPTQETRRTLGGDYDQPDMKKWAMDVFGIFKDPGVLFRWIFLSLVGSIPAFLILASGSKLLLIALMLGGVMLMGAAVVCGFAIMQSVANQHESVSDWPESNPTAWADELILAVGAAALAGGPMWLITTVLLGGPTLLGAAITLLSVFAFFPFIILSMMDMQSIFAPFSAEVARSATRCQEAWGGLYLTSGLLFGGLFLSYAGLSASPPAVASVVWVFATIGVVFCYFAMIGRLAYTIGQTVVEPAKKQVESQDVEPEA